MSKRMIDLKIHMDALALEENESVEDVIEHLEKRWKLPWGYTWEVLYEEIVDD